MSEIETYIERIPMWASKKNSLEDIRGYLRRMGDPDQRMKIIHVAGTNGKGSVCMFLTSMLLEAGYTVGTFVSPHLVSLRERFLLNGEMIEEAWFRQAFLRVKKLSDEKTAEGSAPPTYFEFLFYMAMAVYETCRPDFVILETGLGGRLDATNVIRRPVLTVLTSISMDHRSQLGNSIREIAAQKAGILKPGVPAVFDASDAEAAAVISARAVERGCPQFPVTEQDVVCLGREEGGVRIAAETADVGPLAVTVPSEAEYQQRNAAVAIRAMSVLRRSGVCRFSPEDAARGIRRFAWPGRMEEVLPGVFLDGAHNPGAAESLNRTLRRMQKETGAPVSLLVGAAADKEHKKVLQALCRQLPVGYAAAVRLRSERSADPALLAEELQEACGVKPEIFDDTEMAWNRLLARKGSGLAVCAGSLYLVGEIRAMLKEERHD